MSLAIDDESINPIKIAIFRIQPQYLHSILKTRIRCLLIPSRSQLTYDCKNKKILSDNSSEKPVLEKGRNAALSSLNSRTYLNYKLVVGLSDIAGLIPVFITLKLSVSINRSTRFPTFVLK